MVCKDIKGNEITSIKLGEDGIVYGTNDSILTSYTLDAECCESLGYTFDSDNAICYWSDVKSINDLNVFINSENEDGGYYEVPENSECELDVNFDYLIYFSCANLINCKLSADDIMNLKISYILEAISPDGTKEIIDNFIIYDSNSLLNANTGLYIDEASSRICYKTKSRINKELSVLIPTLNSTTLTSAWVNISKLYSDVDFITSIRGKKLRIGFNILNLPCGFSIKVDNIKLLNRCLVNSTKTTSILKNPSFNIEKLVDNKKVWLDSDSERIHDLKYRETSYDKDDDRLIINSKELDLHFSSDNGVEHDLWVFIKNNPTLITDTSVDGIDMASLLDENYLEINNLGDFMLMLNTRLIDAKSNKTINAYPLLKILYYRYVNSFLYTGVQSNAFTYNDMLNFINILDNYWLELVEQFIPSTTIWGSTIKISNSTMDSEKFVYKKYSTIVIKSTNDLSDFINTEYTNASETIDGVTTNYINGIGIKQLNDGSEFYGKINILKPGIIGENDDIITLSESIDSIKPFR